MELRPIPGYRRYLISQDGTLIQNGATLKPLTIRPGKRGELRVAVMKDDNKPTNVTVARLVLLAWGGERRLPDDASPVPGYDGYYVTLAGDVYSAFQGPAGPHMKLKPQIGNRGYAYIMAYGTTPVTVHKLVLLAFVGPRPSAFHEGRHLNGNRTDNKKDNLCWGTKKENAEDRLLHGTTVRGEEFWSAVLNEEKVREMRRLRREENLSFTTIGERFGVNKVTARHACLGVTWKHVS